MQNPIPRAVVYCRVSTDDQAQAGTIDNQVQFATKYCDLHNITISRFYLDDGISGTIPIENRPEGANLLRDAELHSFKTVYVYCVDRLGRDARVILNAVGQIESHGIRVVSMTEPFDTGTPAGKFMLTILAATAGFGRDSMVERSIAGTNRLAREGAWLGGIVPYGYRVEGKKQEARLIVSEDPIPGISMSEADVIRLIYHLSAEEHLSCFKIAENLNALRIPPSYTKDDRKVLRGKRKENTAGVWRVGRVRNMIASTTYKGLHKYGVRSNRNREIIERSVPAIISEEIWNKAQETLKANRCKPPVNTKREFLLRGLIKCGICGLTFSGVYDNRYPDKHYYKCAGKQAVRTGVSRKNLIDDKYCPSASLRSDIEEVVWQDILGYINNPERILSLLSSRMTTQEDTTDLTSRELSMIQGELSGKERERDSIISLYRRGKITETDLDKQLNSISTEEASLKERRDTLLHRVAVVDNQKLKLKTTESMLKTIQANLTDNMPFIVKREIVQTLIDRIVVDTIEENGKKKAVIKVRYSFTFNETRTASNYTDTDSYSPPA